MDVSQQNCSKKAGSRQHLLKCQWVPKEQYSFSLDGLSGLGIISKCSSITRFCTWQLRTEPMFSRMRESLYTKGIILKDVRCNSWFLPCVPDSGIWQPSWCQKLLSLHSPQSVPRYTQFCQSSLPVNDKNRHFKQTTSSQYPHTRKSLYQMQKNRRLES